MAQHAVQPEELQAYLDSELAAARQGEVSRHIQDCQECSAVIADLQKVSATLQNWKAEAAPANLKPPIVPVDGPQRHWMWSRVAAGFGASIAAMLLVAFIVIYPNLPKSRTWAPSTHRVGEELTPLHGPSSQRIAGAAQGFGGNPNQAADIESPRPTVGRMISYQVRLTVEVKEFEAAKAKLRGILDAEGGYTTNSDFAETPNEPKRATLVLRVPAAKLQTILNQVRALGRVREEHMNSEEVTEQVVDLEARLKNARATEQRLIDVLNNRTGKVADILEVEQEISSTREQIERMEAQRQNLMKRVEMATVTLTLAEEFKAELQTAPVGTVRQLWNASVEGWENVSGSILGIVFFLARYGLSLVLWAGLGWLAWLRLRRPLRQFFTAASNEIRTS